MSKSLRLSEKWFRRGLWLVAFLFAWFLTGLGSTIVGDLPQVEQERTLDDFMDPQRTPELRRTIDVARRDAEEAQAALEQAQLRHQTAQASNRAARETFSNWLATRQATRRPDQDDELMARTQERGWMPARRKAAPRPSYKNWRRPPATNTRARYVPRNCGSSATGWR